MKIRKLFKAENAHIVNNAYSERCRESLHGHSYTYEVFLSSTQYEDAGMVTDFGFIKKYLHPLFDSFDHASIIGNYETEEFKEFFKNNFKRVIITDWNSTAEFQAAFFFFAIEKIIKYLTVNNLWEKGEQEIRPDAVIVHETATGYARYDRQDLGDAYTNYFQFGSNVFNTVTFSDGIKKDWTPEFKKFWEWLNISK